MRSVRAYPPGLSSANPLGFFPRQTTAAKHFGVGLNSNDVGFPTRKSGSDPAAKPFKVTYLA